MAVPERPPEPDKPGPPSIKDVERKLEKIKSQVEALDEEIRKAEARRPPRGDHAGDGGAA